VAVDCTPLINILKKLEADAAPVLNLFEGRSDTQIDMILKRPLMGCLHTDTVPGTYRIDHQKITNALCTRINFLNPRLLDLLSTQKADWSIDLFGR
jgi:hypothetical protein